MQAKVCPLILRQQTSLTDVENNTKYEILLFRHPNQSVQVVKGTVEHHEEILKACQRELQEESGLIVLAQHFKFLFEHDFVAHQQHWHVYFSQIENSQDHWSWQTLDDYGHRFDFFWCPLDEFLQRVCTWDIDQRFVYVIEVLMQYLARDHEK